MKERKTSKKYPVYNGEGISLPCVEYILSKLCYRKEGSMLFPHITWRITLVYETRERFKTYKKSSKREVAEGYKEGRVSGVSDLLSISM